MGPRPTPTLSCAETLLLPPLLPAYSVYKFESLLPAVPGAVPSSATQCPALQPLTPEHEAHPPASHDLTLARLSLLVQDPRCTWCSSRAAPRQPIMRTSSPSTGQAPACPLPPTPGCAGRTCATICPPASLSGPRTHPQVPEGEEEGVWEEGSHGAEVLG